MAFATSENWRPKGKETLQWVLPLSTVINGIISYNYPYKNPYKWPKINGYPELQPYIYFYSIGIAPFRTRTLCTSGGFFAPKIFQEICLHVKMGSF